MKIVQLTTANVKKIKAVHIEPDSNVVIIAGKNAQGKSTVLDSIIYALGGKAVMDEVPIREGEEYAEIVLDLDKFVVSRHLTKTDLGYKQSVQIRSKDGAIYPSPQGMLDKLIEGKAFDPLEFSRIKPIEQQKMLAQLLKLDFTKFETEKGRLEEERREVGREVNRLKARKSELPEPEVNLPDNPIDEEGILKEYEELGKVEKENIVIDNKIANILQEVSDLGKEGTEINKEIIRLQNRLKIIATNTKVKMEEVNQLRTTIVPIERLAYDNIKTNLQDAKAINRKIEDRNLYVRVENELSDKVVEYDKYTQALEELKTAKAEYIASCEYPIEGLEVHEDGVFFNKLPLAQASSAEKLKISLAIVEAFKSDLRICLIKDGSLLDNESMEYLKEWAESKDIQVWIERVEEDDNGAIIIEEGEIKSE